MNGPSIRRAGLTVVLFTIAAKILGLVREMVVAGTYGTSHVVDVYLAGITVPAVIGTILSQALPNAFVPIFAGDAHMRQRGKVSAWVLLGCLGVISVVLWFLAIPVSALTSSGFALAQRAATVVVVRIAAAYVVVATAEALTRSRLFARKEFVRSGAAALWPSVSMIIALTVYPQGGALTLIWGFMIGSLAAVIWNLLPSGRKPAPPTPIETSDSAGSAGRGGPRWIMVTLALGASGFLYPVIDRYLASYLSSGTIAALQYASLVASPPVAIWGLAIGTVILPYLSEKYHRRQVEEARQIIDRAVRWALIGSLPVAIWLVFFGHEVISLLLERGAFDAASRAVTGRLLKAYGLWLAPGVLCAVVGRVFYAALRWRPVFMAAAAGLAAKLILSLWLVRIHGAVGLVVATAAAAACTSGVLLFHLRHEVADGSVGSWARSGTALVGIAAIGALLGVGISHLLPGLTWRGSSVVRVVGGSAAGVLLLLVFGARLGVTEVHRLTSWVAAHTLHRN